MYPKSKHSFNISDRRQAGHTRTSALRLNEDCHGWRLPETEEFMNRQIDKSLQAYQGNPPAKVAVLIKTLWFHPLCDSLGKIGSFIIAIDANIVCTYRATELELEHSGFAYCFFKLQL